MFTRAFVVLGLVLGVHSAVAQTPEIQALHRRCNAGDMAACGMIGMAYEMGLGVARNDTLAVKLFQRACEGGNMPACDSMRVMLTRPRPPH